jgi:ADP-ribosylglycohydrolase
MACSLYAVLRRTGQVDQDALAASFADLPRVLQNAERSAAVTHAHFEGVAGTVAVAVAA